VRHRNRSALRLLADLRPDPHDPVSVHVDTPDPAEAPSIVLVELIVQPAATGSDGTVGAADTDDRPPGPSGAPAATPMGGRNDDGAPEAPSRRPG
jgi:hypothetical protein